MKIVITNKKRGGRGHYVGRPSVLGNPFPLKHEGERDRVVEMFRDYFRTAIKEKNEVRSAMNKLWRELVGRGELELTCWCSPRKCHAEVIADALAEAGKKRGMEVEVVYK